MAVEEEAAFQDFVEGRRLGGSVGCLAKVKRWRWQKKSRKKKTSQELALVAPSFLLVWPVGWFSWKNLTHAHSGISSAGFDFVAVTYHQLGFIQCLFFASLPCTCTWSCNLQLVALVSSAESSSNVCRPPPASLIRIYLVAKRRIKPFLLVCLHSCLFY